MDHVNEHCNLHKLLPEYQSAYRNGSSCETTIIRLVNDILWAMENQNVTAVMALDLSVAFDTVDVEILSSVLEHNFGLEDTVLNWFNSYLNHRSCKVNIGKELCSWTMFRNYTIIIKQNEKSTFTLEKNIHQAETYLSAYLKVLVQAHSSSTYIAA